MSQSSGYFGHERQEMLKYVPRSAQRVLSIGCGSGRTEASLKDRQNAEVWGVETSSEAADEATKRLDRVLVGDIEAGSFAFPSRFFDCILFNDVLEHLRHPCDILIQSREWLVDDGCIVASIPNVRYVGNIHHLLVDKDWQYTKEGILDETHLRFFTEKSIRDMFARCGYSITVMEGLLPARFSWKMRLLNMLLRHSLDDMRYLQFAIGARKARTSVADVSATRYDA